MKILLDLAKNGFPREDPKSVGSVDHLGMSYLLKKLERNSINCEIVESSGGKQFISSLLLGMNIDGRTMECSFFLLRGIQAVQIPMIKIARFMFQ